MILASSDGYVEPIPKEEDLDSRWVNHYELAHGRCESLTASGIFKLRTTNYREIQDLSS